MRFRLVKIFCAALVVFMLLAALPVVSFAAGGGLYVNGAVFAGTFEQALAAAMPGGVVEIEGRVFTRPVGWTNITVEDIAIKGRGTAAVLALEPFYFADYSNKVDVLTIKGSNVTVQNLTINAGLRVDFPLRVFGTHVLVEDVICVGGLRGAVNILGLRPGSSQTYRRVQANQSGQGGFYFDDDTDCSGLTLEDCVTRGNLRAGVLVRNGYEAVRGLDLSGVTCREGVFAIEDREAGTLGGGPRADITLLAPPKNTGGAAIDWSRARRLDWIEKSYTHLRFGMKNVGNAGEQTARYGFDAAISNWDFSSLMEYIGYTLKQASTLWIPAIYV